MAVRGLRHLPPSGFPALVSPRGGGGASRRPRGAPRAPREGGEPALSSPDAVSARAAAEPTLTQLTVLWSDGEPVRQAVVVLAQGQRVIRAGTTDHEGRVEIGPIEREAELSFLDALDGIERKRRRVAGKLFRSAMESLGLA